MMRAYNGRIAAEGYGTLEFRQGAKAPYVYSHWCDEVLLYVGSGIGRRAVTFQRRKYSKDAVTRIKLISVHETRKEAYEAEQALLDVSDPLYNTRAVGVKVNEVPMKSLTEEQQQLRRNEYYNKRNAKLRVLRDIKTKPKPRH